MSDDESEYERFYDDSEFSEAIREFVSFAVCPELGSSVVFLGSGQLGHDLDVEWSTHLKFNETDFCFGNERLILVPRCGVSIETLSLPSTISSKMQFDTQSNDFSLQLRTSGNGAGATGYVAMSFFSRLESEEDGGNAPKESFVFVLRFDASAVNRILRKAGHTFCRASAGQVYLFRTPTDTVVKKDNWWDKKYPKAAKQKLSYVKGGSSSGRKSAGGDGDGGHDKDPYSAYRSIIDGLIEERVDDILRNEALPPFDNPLAGGVVAVNTSGPGACQHNIGSGGGGGGGGGSAEGLHVTADETAPKTGWDVAELCAGDGSLAARLVRDPPWTGAFSSYLLLERNKALLRIANSKLTGTSSQPDGKPADDAGSQEIAQLSLASASSSSSVKHDLGERVPPPKVRLFQIDTASPVGQDLIGSLSVDLWIASGSTLCGQVGSPAMVEPTLMRMVESLRHGGLMVITGFTITFFTPSLLKRTGLRVRHASLPSHRADGLGSDTGLFHMWVLQKPFPSNSGVPLECAASEASSGEHEGAETLQKLARDL